MQDRFTQLMRVLRKRPAIGINCPLDDFRHRSSVRLFFSVALKQMRQWNRHG